MEPSTRVILWSAPRCLSSAFERSVRELESVKVLYEPHLGVFYPESLDSKYASCTYDSAEEKLTANYDGCSAVFVKEMAYFIPKERLSKYMKLGFRHSILIRNPQKSIPSLWKVCATGYDLEKDTFLALCELYNCARSMGREVTVVDADDLLSNPEGIMRKYCAETGLTYDDKMLSWSPGVVEDWTENKGYKDWNWNAMYSSGFNKMTTSKNEEKAAPTEILPSAVQDEIENSMPYYELLFKHRMKLP